MISKNSALDEMIQYFYDNYDFYMKKAEELISVLEAEKNHS